MVDKMGKLGSIDFQHFHLVVGPWGGTNFGTLPALILSDSVLIWQIGCSLVKIICTCMSFSFPFSALTTV